MKSTLRPLLLSIALLAALTAPAFAADAPEGGKEKNRPPAGERGPARRNRMDQLSEDAKLTADQKAKLAPVLQDEAKKLKEIRDNTELTKEQKAAKTKEIRSESSAKIKDVLTPEQTESLKKAREERAKNAPNGGGRGGRRQGGEKPGKPNKAE